MVLIQSPFTPFGQKTASSDSGNATVPVDAPILPYQAFVDNIQALASTTTISLASKGITHFDSALLYDDDTYFDAEVKWCWRAEYARRAEIILAGSGNEQVINLSGNALPTADVDAILAGVAEFVFDNVIDAGQTTAGTINLSGGTNGAPTVNGAGVVAGEGGGGYSLNGTLNGKNQYHRADGFGGFNTISWSGTQWELNVPNGDGIIYTSTDAVSEPWLVTSWTDVFSIGSITVTHSNVGKAELVANGWTVTTN